MAVSEDRSGLPQPGDLIDGRYRVTSLLGEGGMGAVYAAQDLTFNERVAIKAMLPALRDRGAWSKRFVREARAARVIDNEHVAQVLNVGELLGGSPYMVLEYLDGRPLDEVIRARAPLPQSDAVDYLLQACEGIAHAHARKIVHRDLKPSNLFLARRRDGTTAVKGTSTRSASTESRPIVSSIVVVTSASGGSSGTNTTSSSPSASTRNPSLTKSKDVPLRRSRSRSTGDGTSRRVFGHYLT